MTWDVLVISMSAIVGMFVGGSAMTTFLDRLESRHQRANGPPGLRRPGAARNEAGMARNQPT